MFLENQNRIYALIKFGLYLANPMLSIIRLICVKPLCFVQVVLMGASAGAMGTEVNCDKMADMLHLYNPDLDVR